MIRRKDYLDKINELLSYYPVVGLVGPRQVGKTTLARQLAERYTEPVNFFDLEDPTSIARLSDPMLALQDLHGLVVIDEVQHLPGLFKVLRVLADRPEIPCRFLILGSASPTLLKQSSESLAGRIAYVEVKGLSLDEVGTDQLNELWIRGGFPRAFLAPTEAKSYTWRQEFIRAFLERDLPQLGINIPAITMRRFWLMLAHYHGQLWNVAEFARAFGMSDKIVRHYLDILVGTYVVQQLPPWWENIGKRQVKAYKIYISDTGLLHTLLGLRDREAVESHPKVGASWEGFAMNAVITQLNAQPEETFFWRTHAGAELDLIIIHGNTRLGFEFKRTASPTLTRSIQIALEDLQLSHVYIIHAGKADYTLAPDITALSLTSIINKLKPLV